MLSALVELIFGFVIEIVFEAIGEVLSELGFNLWENSQGIPMISPILRGITYVVVGVLLAIISYFIMPVHVVDNRVLRIAMAIASIVSMGFMMCLVSWFVVRKDRYEPLWSTEKFVHGIVFGASYSITRAFVVG